MGTEAVGMWVLRFGRGNEEFYFELSHPFLVFQEKMLRGSFQDGGIDKDTLLVALWCETKKADWQLLSKVGE